MALHGHREPRGFSERGSPVGKSDFSFSNASLRLAQQGKPRGGISNGEEPTSVRFIDNRQVRKQPTSFEMISAPALSDHYISKQDFLGVVKLLVDYINSLHAK